jgi:serine protease
MNQRTAPVAVGLLGLLAVPVFSQESIRTSRPVGDAGLYVSETRDLATLPAVSATRLVVKFDPTLDTSGLDGLLAPLQARVAGRGYDGDFEVLEVPHGAVDAWVSWLRSQPHVVYAEPEGLCYALGTPPNDTFWSYQWHMMDRGAVSGVAASNFGVQAPEAWTKSTGTGAIVAVVDTGVAYENFGSFAQAPDLVGTNFVAGYDFINNDAHANDDEGHGTHVAGTIAQSTNNGQGTAGVAFGATIMPVKVLSSTGSGSWTSVANGIRFAADNGADVINLSLGGSGGSTVLEDAINYAWSRGVVICAATGNSGTSSIGFPAAYSNCIAVGATRFDGNRAPYSQYGNGIDVSAPGGDTSVDQNGDGYGDGVLQQTFGTSVTSFGYYFFQGTSMATPHVAGVAALVKAARPTATAAEVRAAIESSCVDRGTAGYDTTFGHGIVDANAAVDAILGGGGGGGGDVTPPAAPAGLSATAGNASVALDWSNNTEADLDGYVVYRATSAAGPFTALNAALLLSSAYADGTVDNGATYYYHVTAVDTSGNESQTSATVSATPRAPDTTPPAAPAGLSATAGNGTVALDWSNNTEADLDGYIVYRATSASGPFAALNANPRGQSAYTDSSVSNGTTYYYRVTAVDTSGNESVDSATVSGTPEGGDTTPPAAPTGLSGSTTRNSVSLNWADNGESDLAGYFVYRATRSGGPYTRVNSSPVPNSDYVDTGRNRRTRYFYYVTATDTSGNESGQSGRIRVRTRR